MEWGDLRYILLAARHGTLAGAARQMGVDPTTVSRRIAAAEEALGIRLFERLDGSLRATREGEAVVERAARIEQEVRSLEPGSLRSEIAIRGRVRISAVPVVVESLLIPNVQSLYEAHPELCLELVAEGRNVNLSRRDADIALRLARPESGAVLTRRLATIAYAVYRNSASHGPDLPWINYEEGSSHLPQAQWLARQQGPVSLLVNDMRSAIAAVMGGLGRSVLPGFAADATDGIEPVGAPVLTRELWLLVHRDLRREPRVAAVIDWLVSAARNTFPPSEER